MLHEWYRIMLQQKIKEQFMNHKQELITLGKITFPKLSIVIAVSLGTVFLVQLLCSFFQINL